VIRAILDRTWHVQLIATLASSIVLTNLAMIVFGTQPREVPTTLSATVLEVGGVRMAWHRLLVLGAAVGIFAGLPWFAARTKTGKAMRAMSQNREACAVVLHSPLRATPAPDRLPGLSLFRYLRVMSMVPRRTNLVGVRGFEPPAPCSQSRCATGLRHTPTSGNPTT
jgi:hypothetical protein